MKDFVRILKILFSLKLLKRWFELREDIKMKRYMLTRVSTTRSVQELHDKIRSNRDKLDQLGR
jgi:hypothetical protein